ncbi:RraA family protein [Elongatibacter sediminis]|uniref:Putative 4-hydroxy-4-methyl-2-oxoglutarate aldolase n=1 Tax=Elongatibacter sediminis TaxID=3119006 RepID=A0AAW9RJ35_9GAMM
MKFDAYERFQHLLATDFADVLKRDRVMDPGIRPLWQPMPYVAGPAYPVRCAPGDNTALHAAIYRAPRGAIIVAQAGDQEYALSGGNVCAVAQKNGIAGFVVDGLVRDLGEVRELEFPVFARGVIPKPGRKDGGGEIDVAVRCGGVEVHPGDIIVADEEGIIAIPADDCEAVLSEAERRAARAAAQSLEEWERDHRAKIEKLMGPDQGNRHD